VALALWWLTDSKTWTIGPWLDWMRPSDTEKKYNNYWQARAVMLRRNADKETLDDDYPDAPFRPG
jgi:hypothetical protein